MGREISGSARVAERRRDVRAHMMRRRRRTIVAVLLLATISVGGWAFARSSFFALSRIEVRGVRTLTAEDVIRASGLRIGQSVLTLDGDAVEARLRGLALIRRAGVRREAASVVVITIVERTPALEVRMPDARYFVDDDGRRFQGRPAPGARVPLLRVLPPPPRPAPGSTAKPGAKGAVGAKGKATAKGASSSKGAPAEDAPAAKPPPAPRAIAPGPAVVAAVLEVWRGLPPEVAARVRWFEAPAANAVAARIGRVDVIFGSPDRVAEKVLAYKLIVRRVTLDRRGLRRVDLRAPRRPAAVVG